MSLNVITKQIADALVNIDSSRIPFRAFNPGVGPYGEPQLVREIARLLALQYPNRVLTKRTPDLLIQGMWALEFKIVRPFGDNGKEAEKFLFHACEPRNLTDVESF